MAQIIHSGSFAPQSCNPSPKPQNTRTRQPAFGHQTARRLRRSLFVYTGLLWLAAVSTMVLPHPHAWRFAFGLLVPGGGFMGEPVLLPLAGITLTVFCAAIVIWFATGNIVLPPLVWLGSALAVFLLPTHAAAPPLFFIQILGFGGPVLALTYAFWRVSRPKLHPLATAPISTSLMRPAAAATEDRQPKDHELSPEALRAMRLLLDRALQPIADFDGFEWRDQFQTAATRYQLNFTAYALALAQSVHMPAATAYLATAQQNLLAKQGDPRVWHYWQYEHAWGYLARDEAPSLEITSCIRSLLLHR